MFGLLVIFAGLVVTQLTDGIVVDMLICIEDYIISSPRLNRLIIKIFLLLATVILICVMLDIKI